MSQTTKHPLTLAPPVNLFVVSQGFISGMLMLLLSAL